NSRETPPRRFASPPQGGDTWDRQSRILGISGWGLFASVALPVRRKKRRSLSAPSLFNLVSEVWSDLPDNPHPGSQSQTLKLEPQPQVVDAFGFLITNCAPSRSSL